MSDPVSRPWTKDDELLVLSSSYCRQILQYFVAHSTADATVDDLIDHCTMFTADTTASGRKRIAIALHHTALPKLAANDIIDWQREAEHVHVTATSFLEEPIVAASLSDLSAERGDGLPVEQRDTYSASDDSD